MQAEVGITTLFGKRMKKAVILASILGGALFAGCASQEVLTPKNDDRHAALSSKVDSDVPLPEHTPYDSNPELKALYLEGYASGYKMARPTGFSASCDIAGSREHPERAQAYIDGHFAGSEAGVNAWESKEEPNKAAEPTRTTVTPPAGAGDRASGAPGSP